MSAKEIIDARPETLGRLITFSSNPTTIWVPVYQRFYQWDQSKILDILKLTDPDSRDFGFIGTMVFVQNRNQSLEVVDGQQRLISVILILCALRDYIREYMEGCADSNITQMLGDMSRDIQNENLLVSKSYSEATDNPRLAFNRSSYDVFKEKYLVGNPDFVPEEVKSRIELKNFSNNYDEAKKYLRDKYGHHKVKEITPLLNKRLERLKGLVVNAIYITKPEYAGEVFESINGTGITLKLSELVKNYVFRSVTSPATAQTKWEQVESNCDNKVELIENIIKYDWQNRHEETQDFEIFRSIKANVKNVDGYLDRILRVSKIFTFYLHPNVENFKYLKLEDNRNDKNHIVKFSSTLRVINVKQFLRLIIALDAVREYININDYLKLLKNIHNFQVRAKVSNIATNEVDRLYSKHGRKLQRISNDISDGKLTKKEAQLEIRKQLFNILPADLIKISSNDAFIAGLTTYSRTKSTGKDFFKYLLGSIENHMQRSELTIDTKDNQITLEEIYPQEPAIGWGVTDLGPEDIYRFGNATILKGKDNGAGSNKVISEKYPIYENSNLLLNKQLVGVISNNNMKWNKESLAKRSRVLSENAAEIWKL
jgi:uncharacterized protein with ParB-like and HNH nuclease domain